MTFAMLREPAKTTAHAVSANQWLPAPLPLHEGARLESIARLRVGGPGREAAFNRITALAAELFDVPMAFITIIGSDIQRICGGTGSDIQSTSRDNAICGYTILRETLLVVPDLRLDPRFAAHPDVVSDGGLRFYAGAPLVVEGGHALGALCLLDTRPRNLSPAERERLRALAATVVDLIRMRVDGFVAEEQRRELAVERQRLHAAIAHLDEGVALFCRDRRLLVWNPAFADQLGCPPATLRPGLSDRQVFTSLARLGTFEAEHIAAAVQLIGRDEEVARLHLPCADGRVIAMQRQRTADWQSVLTTREAGAGEERRCWPAQQVVPRAAARP